MRLWWVVMQDGKELAKSFVEVSEKPAPPTTLNTTQGSVARTVIMMAVSTGLALVLGIYIGKNQFRREYIRING